MVASSVHSLIPQFIQVFELVSPTSNYFHFEAFVNAVEIDCIVLMHWLVEHKNENTLHALAKEHSCISMIDSVRIFSPRDAGILKELKNT